MNWLKLNFVEKIKAADQRRVSTENKTHVPNEKQSVNASLVLSYSYNREESEKHHLARAHMNNTCFSRASNGSKLSEKDIDLWFKLKHLQDFFSDLM